MSGLDWLIARPIAHRGLHDAANGVIENTPSAFLAAIAAGYGIECDLQISADGEAVVYHDETLDRLTEGYGRLDTMTAAELGRIAFKATADRIVTLGELCDFVAGRTSLVVEIKSRFDGDCRLAACVAKVLSGYRGPAAAMSFDAQMVAALRAITPRVARGLLAPSRRRGRPLAEPALARGWHALRANPQFIAYSVTDLPAALPMMARKLWGLPVLTWVVRTDAEHHKAKRYADQMIFEGFRP
ncbi:MAG TPA: glycerophosphodiester phosphodiesterase family protein [Xanthobacteraceae bacterium]|jgi:glycerophosphoryl diester phosphodiesterase